MINYTNDTLDLINGETPKEKYNHMILLNNLIEMIATPRKGSDEDAWCILDIVEYINAHNLIPNKSNY